MGEITWRIEKLDWPHPEDKGFTVTVLADVTSADFPDRTGTWRCGAWIPTQVRDMDNIEREVFVHIRRDLKRLLASLEGT